MERASIQVHHANEAIARSVANALRRTMLVTGSVAPGSVTITKNDSVMTDDQLAHRIGMVVFPNDVFGIEELRLCAVSDTVSTRCVFVSDIVRADGRPALPDDQTPLVMLGPGASLELTIVLRNGSGAEHARFCPVQVASIAKEGHNSVVYFETTGARSADTVRRQVIQELRDRVIAARAEISASALSDSDRAPRDARSDAAFQPTARPGLSVES